MFIVVDVTSRFGSIYDLAIFMYCSVISVYKTNYTLKNLYQDEKVSKLGGIYHPSVVS